MKLKLDRIQAPFQFEVKNENGNSIIFDAKPDIGGNNEGIRPMEGVAASLAACAAIDVIFILEKQKIEIADFKVDIDASRVDAVPAIFETIHLKFIFKGDDLPLNKLERAVELSMTKYCSVSKMLNKSCEITYSVEYKKN